MRALSTEAASTTSSACEGPLDDAVLTEGVRTSGQPAAHTLVVIGNTGTNVQRKDTRREERREEEG